MFEIDDLHLPLLPRNRPLLTLNEAAIVQSPVQLSPGQATLGKMVYISRATVPVHPVWSSLVPLLCPENEDRLR